MTNAKATEPARPAPDFLVYVHRPDGAVDVTHAVMDVYDVAVNSLDFGSGFLSTEEVENLRHLGKAIGADPLPRSKDSCAECNQLREHHRRAEHDFSEESSA